MGEGVIFHELQIKCLVCPPESETDFADAKLGNWSCRPKHSWNASWAAIVCLVTTVLNENLQKTARVWRGRMLPLLWSTNYQHLPAPTEAVAESSQHFVGSDHHLMIRPLAIKAFRYSHTELMKVYKHEVLILTTAMKYDYWNIYFHFKYLFICVLHCWYAYTVWGWNLNSLASSPLGTFLLFALSPALML